MVDEEGDKCVHFGEILSLIWCFLLGIWQPVKYTGLDFSKCVWAAQMEHWEQSPEELCERSRHRYFLRDTTVLRESGHFQDFVLFLHEELS